MICFFYSARASPSWSSANLLTTCFSVLLKSNGSHHGKATICPKMFFPFPEIRGIIRVSYASFLIPAKNFAVFWVKFAIAIYPREGTKTWFLSSCFVVVCIAIYPREGTKTLSGLLQQAHNVLLPFIPARGRKPEISFGAFNRRHIAIYPREGTKKHLCHWRLPAAEVLCFFYILFYRLGATPAGIVFVTGSALTPCGTSGFMGRISCR